MDALESGSAAISRERKSQTEYLDREEKQVADLMRKEANRAR